MSVICRKFLLKLALRTMQVLCLSMDRGNQGQQWRGTTQTAINCDTFWLQTLGRHEIQKFIYYCTVFALFYFVFEGTFQVQAPRGLYSEGRFNGGFFALRVWGAYIWRGLYMEGPIFGILRYSNICLHSRFLRGVHCLLSWLEHRPWCLAIPVRTPLRANHLAAKFVRGGGG